MNDITAVDVKFDKDIRKARIIDYRQHGRVTGIQRQYYFCDKCQVGWGSLPPYETRHFLDNGIWYGIARPIRGLMPACPDCRSRDHVHKLNRYKKKKYTLEEKTRLNAEYGRNAKIYTGEENDQSIR